MPFVSNVNLRFPIPGAEKKSELVELDFDDIMGNLGADPDSSTMQLELKRWPGRSGGGGLRHPRRLRRVDSRDEGLNSSRVNSKGHIICQSLWPGGPNATTPEGLAWLEANSKKVELCNPGAASHRGPRHCITECA